MKIFIYPFGFKRLYLIYYFTISFLVTL
ncbi:MAG: hypothetical protein RLZZ306_82, partial [Bacteroidota bacterium]